MGLEQLQINPVFFDVRLVHLPRPLVASLLEEYLNRAGFQTNQTLSPHGCIEEEAVNPKPSWALFREGKPKRLSYLLEDVGGNATRIRMVGSVERTIEYFSYCLAGMVPLSVNSWLGMGLALRGWLHRSDSLTLIGFFFPWTLAMLGSFGIFSWGWSRLGAQARPISRFYHELGQNGIAHEVLNLPPVCRDQWVCASIVLAGMSLAALQLIMASRSLGLLIFVGVIFASLAVVLARSLRPGHLIARFLHGQVALGVATSLAAGWLLPQLCVIIFEDDIRQCVYGSPPLTAQTMKVVGTGAIVGAVFLGSALLPLLMTRVSRRFVSEIDFCRAHLEVHRWATPAGRGLLALGLWPMLFAFGGLLTICFIHCVVYLQSLIFGQHTKLYSPELEKLITEVNALLGSIGRLAGIQITSPWPAKILFVALAVPLLRWGGAHLSTVARELFGYLRYWKQQSQQTETTREQVCALVAAMAKFGRVRAPLVRIIPSSAVYAFIPISPIPFFPRFLLISQGAVTLLPPEGVEALLAHEIGHLKHGHSLRFELLRFVSRMFLLGTSFLTGLIKPSTQLEAEADLFAVQWLELKRKSREHLVQVLQVSELQKFSGLVGAGTPSGIGAVQWNSADWLPTPLRQVFQNLDHLSVFRRGVFSWRVMEYLVIESDLATYSYASFSDRIGTIRRLKQSSER